MLVAKEAVEIRVLRRQGKSIRAIARMLDAYKHYLAERVKAAAPDWIPATVLLRELKALGYAGGIQVMLLAGLDFIERYGVDVQPGEETLIHDVLDLTYIINALLVGGVASRDSTILRRFKFLLPNVVVLR
jgi:hypothetical protein